MFVTTKLQASSANLLLFIAHAHGNDDKFINLYRFDEDSDHALVKKKS